MRKTLLLAVLLLVLSILMPLECSAFDEQSQQEEQRFLEQIPEQLTDYFLDEQGRLTIPKLERMIGFCYEVLVSSLKHTSVPLKRMLSLILLSSLFSLFESATQQENSKGVLRLCVLITGFLSVGQALTALFSLTEEHLGQLCGFLSGILPILNGVQLSMGAINSASVSVIALTMLLSLIGEFTVGVLLPLQQITFAFDITSLLTANSGLSSFASSIKKLFLFLFGGASSFLLGCFALQNVVAAKADSAALRAFRFTAGGLVPIVGSALSESSRVLLSGLDLLRSTVGGVAITVILLTLLPPLFTLLVTAFSFSCAASLSKAVENDLLSSIFLSATSVANSLMALVVLCDLSAIFAIAIFLSQIIQ